MRGILIQQNLFNTLFMVGVNHGVNQTNHNGLSTLIHQFSDLDAHVRLIKRHNQLTLKAEALANALNHVWQNQRGRALSIGQILFAQLVQTFTVTTATTERHHRLITRRHQHADARTFVLDQGIGTQRSGVANRIHSGKNTFHGEIKLSVCTLQGFIKTEREILVGRQRFGFNVLVIPHYKAIGKRTTDIY